MSNSTTVKRGLTLAWSIGLALLLLGITTVLLLPATKSARIRFDATQQESLQDESLSSDPDDAANDAHLEDESSPDRSP